MGLETGRTGDQGPKTSKIVLSGEVDFGEEYQRFSDLAQGSRRFMLLQGSAVSLTLPDNSVDHIVTDPPYFDSVQYSDLAAYFRVWLRQLLPDEAQWDYALSEATVDQHENGNGQYRSVLGDIFKEAYRVLKKDSGRLIFTYHHWNPKGWTGLSLALKQAGFGLLNRYIIHAENLTSVHIANQNALIHDVVLVLGSAQKNTFPEWELPEAIDKTDSYTFCEQCGSVLGYILNHALAEDEIGQIWVDLLK